MHLRSFCPAQKCPTKEDYSPTSLIGLSSASALRDKKCFRSRALKEAHFYSLHKGTGCVAAPLESPACSCLTFFFFSFHLGKPSQCGAPVDRPHPMSSAPGLPVWSLSAPPGEEGKSWEEESSPKASLQWYLHYDFEEFLLFFLRISSAFQSETELDRGGFGVCVCVGSEAIEAHFQRTNFPSRWGADCWLILATYSLWAHRIGMCLIRIA